MARNKIQSLELINTTYSQSGPEIMANTLLIYVVTPAELVVNLQYQCMRDAMACKLWVYLFWPIIFRGKHCMRRHS